MDVGAWLGALGLRRYEQAFRDNDVDARVLPGLTADDLKEIGVTSVGHRRLLLQAIAALGTVSTPAGSVPAEIAVPAVHALPQAERRQLTVMFVDLVGSTELSRRLDPEEMREIIQTYQNTVAGEVSRFEGHVAKYMGDGVLAYFGWPRAQEDAAERAVRVGLAVTAAVGGLEAPDGEPLAARVGVATGAVVIGELVGSEEARERAVVGEAPNLAARLQALAQPGTVVVAEGTRHLVGDLFAMRDLGLTDLKGYAEPIRAWQVVGEGTAEGRFEALHPATALTPLIGREHELALLLDRWARAKGGEGQVVLLTGEPGIGKSRLVRALRERLSDEPHTWLGQFCSPYHINTALHPVTGLIERAAGLRRDEPPECQLDRLEAMLAGATAKVAEAAPLLADLLGILAPAGRYPPLELSPRQKKERTFQVLIDQLAGLAAREPVLALYEDMHWADPTTLELLGRVVERVQRLPVLAVVTFRPEFIPPWTRHGHVTAFSLARLGRRQGAVMIDEVTKGKMLPSEVLDTILAQTDGVPLFVEELTKTVLESGLLRDAGDRYELDHPFPPLAIPLTLQDSLMARLDRLAAVREVAQAAAVVGREFGHELLAAVVGFGDNELRDALAQLVEAGLVFRHGEGARASYLFKHALVRDAAYHTLLRSRRQQLHARIAAVLEERFPERAAAEPELLARHNAWAGLAEQAIQYWLRAAELALARSANQEAAIHCEEAETELRMLPPSEQHDRIELEVQFARGIAVRAGQGYSALEVERVFSRASQLCEQLGERVRLIHALRSLWAFYYVAGRWPEAARVAERIASAAGSTSDRIAVTIREYVVGATLAFRGQPAEAVRRLRQALRHYDESDRKAHIRHSGHDTASSIRAHLAMAEWLAGRPETALSTIRDGLAAARQVAHPFSLAQMLTFGVLVTILAQEWDVAAALAAEERELGARLGIATHEALSTMLGGIATAARDNVRRGAEEIRRGTAALRGTGGQCLVPFAQAQLASALVACGDAASALAAAAEAVRLARENEEFAWESEALRTLGEVRLAAGERDAAEADLRAALNVARRQSARSFELRAATSLSRLWAAEGERRKAHELLAPVYAGFAEGLDTTDLTQARALLDETG